MNSIALPLLIPFAIAIVLLAVRSDKLSRIIGPLGSLAMLAAALYLTAELQQGGIMSFNVGGWDAPYGIVLVIDYLSSLMLLVSSLIAFVIALYANRNLPADLPVSRFYFFFFTKSLNIVF